MRRRAVLYRFTDFLGVRTDSVFSYKVDKTDLSGMSVNFYQTTRRVTYRKTVVFIYTIVRLSYFAKINILP
jgi:hypothetical protein